MHRNVEIILPSYQEQLSKENFMSTIFVNIWCYLLTVTPMAQLPASLFIAIRKPRSTQAGNTVSYGSEEAQTKKMLSQKLANHSCDGFFRATLVSIIWGWIHVSLVVVCTGNPDTYAVDSMVYGFFEFGTTNDMTFSQFCQL